MAKKLADIFKDLDTATLQQAADVIYAELSTPEARLTALNSDIAGQTNPSFERSQVIIAWAKEQKRMGAEAKTFNPRPSRTVTTPSKFPRRVAKGMTW